MPVGMDSAAETLQPGGLGHPKLVYRVLLGSDNLRRSWPGESAALSQVRRYREDEG